MAQSTPLDDNAIVNSEPIPVATAESADLTADGERVVDGSASSAPAATPHEDDVFDPSEYVKNLIARMDNKAGRNTPASQPKEDARTPSDNNAPLDASTAKSSGTVMRDKVVRPSRAEEFGANSSVPADPRRLRSQHVSLKDMEKLREAAILTSSSDLKVSACAVRTRRAYAELAGTAGCLAVSFVMLVMARGPHSLPYLASAFSLAIACIGAICFSGSLNQLVALHKQEEANQIESRDKLNLSAPATNLVSGDSSHVNEPLTS